MIHLSNVSKVFGTGVAGLASINLDIDKGEFVFLVGKTGSGKTTLLKLLIREMLPTEGTITIGEWDIVSLPEKHIPLLRKKVGVVFQDLKLLMDRTIGENILLPLQVAGRDVQDAANRVDELLQEVGMIEHKEKFPVQLSGGELQRIAIARALALSPEILLADEPTGNLDEATAFDIVDLLSRINEHGTTIIMATHNMDIVKKLKQRVIGLESGKLIGDTKKSSKSQETSSKNEKEADQKGEKEDKKENKEDKNNSSESEKKEKK
ncbi:MAG TPA: ATP-binding cassette domain-containing protein [Patescibacteria group bacterium]|nr:ATP-binding cassette domain-containing protein [Patescibacteria group bacterium]